MDNKDNESFLEKLKNVQKSMSNITLPSMGLIDDNNRINLDNSKLFEDKNNNTKSVGSTNGEES